MINNKLRKNKVVVFKATNKKSTASYKIYTTTPSTASSKAANRTGSRFIKDMRIF